MSIFLNEEKCVGCNSCVRVCPAPNTNIAKFNDNGKMIISINQQNCISCGACIKTCAHGARYYKDDTENFFEDLKKGVDIILIVAPAIKVGLDGYWRHALKWLKEKGVSAIYDVSHGADICTWAHLRYIEKNENAKIISQPCAAIVNYVLKHKHELISYLSPVHSPMLCEAVYIKKYLGKNAKIAALSPCIAKKDEFQQTGLIDYNITFERLKQYFSHEKGPASNYRGFCEFEFDNEQGLLGSIYPEPGGLKINLLTHMPNLHIFNSEGILKVYKELNEYAQEKTENLPTVFDVLNCEFGCNDGPGLGENYKSFSMYKVMNDVQSYVSQKRIENNKASETDSDLKFAEFDSLLNINDFIRKYTPISVKTNNVSESELNEAFELMGKKTQSERSFDCHACGFSSCREMAEAIANGYNVPENCHQYIMYKLKKERELIENVNKSVCANTNEIESLFAVLNQNIAKTQSDSQLINKLGQEGYNDMLQVNNYTLELLERGKEIFDKIRSISKEASNYKKITDSVADIAQNINLLSFNASIEAARAGEAGKGFAVIANSIRELSENSRKSVQSASLNDKNIQIATEQIKNIIESFNEDIKKLSSIAENTMSDVKKTSENSKLISESMDVVTKLSSDVQNLIERTNQILNNN